MRAVEVVIAVGLVLTLVLIEAVGASEAFLRGQEVRASIRTVEHDDNR